MDQQRIDSVMDLWLSRMEVLDDAWEKRYAALERECFGWRFWAMAMTGLNIVSAASWWLWLAK